MGRKNTMMQLWRIAGLTRLYSYSCIEVKKDSQPPLSPSLCFSLLPYLLLFPTDTVVRRHRRRLPLPEAWVTSRDQIFLGCETEL
jgi:hypothetical protein